MSITVGHSGHHCCVSVMSFLEQLTPLFVLIKPTLFVVAAFNFVVLLMIKCISISQNVFEFFCFFFPFQFAYI